MGIGNTTQHATSWSSEFSRSQELGCLQTPNQGIAFAKSKRKQAMGIPAQWVSTATAHMELSNV
jgi:hypothetical protein